MTSGRASLDNDFSRTARSAALSRTVLADVEGGDGNGGGGEDELCYLMIFNKQICKHTLYTCECV
jgi:hypothetical protein